MVALSKLLSADLSTDLLYKANKAMSTLTSAMQDKLAVGEEPVVIHTDNARVSASMEDPADVLQKTFTSALTELEIFEGKSAAKVNIAKPSDAVDTGANAVGVSVVQVTSTGSVSDSAPTGLQLTEYKSVEDDTDGGGRRLMKMDSRGLQNVAVEKVNVTIALQNLRPFTYPSVAATESVSDCDPLDTAGYIEVRCEHMNADTLLSSPTTHILDCPTGKERRYTFTCPKYDFKPQCSIWDDVTQAYTIRDNCSVTAYDSMSTTCECEVDGVVANSARRRLDVDESGQSDSVTRLTFSIWNGSSPAP